MRSLPGANRCSEVLATLRHGSRISDIAGKSYSELDETSQHRFLDYGLSVNLFVSTTREEVRKVFRRMNSYTVPLNAEEHR
jgi:hypothetical protein